MMQCNPLVKKCHFVFIWFHKLLFFLSPKCQNTTRCHKVCGMAVDPKYYDSSDLQLLRLVWGKGMSEF